MAPQTIVSTASTSCFRPLRTACISVFRIRNGHVQHLKSFSRNRSIHALMALRSSGCTVLVAVDILNACLRCPPPCTVVSTRACWVELDDSAVQCARKIELRGHVNAYVRGEMVDRGSCIAASTVPLHEFHLRMHRAWAMTTCVLRL